MFQNNERRTTWIVLFLLVAAAVISLTTSYIAHTQSNSVDYWSWLDGAAQNFSTEMMGAIATFVLIEVMFSSQKTKRETAQQIAELQKRLIREAGGQSNETAKAAIDRLCAEGWLKIKDRLPLLAKANLENAKLQGADMYEANLQETILCKANLQGTTLRQANLQGAKLEGTNLQGANLRQANLQDANLWSSNLQAANLEDANLQGAILGVANLQAANLWGTNLHEADLREVNLQAANLLEANLQGANLRQANLREVDLGQANLRAANLLEVNLQGAKYIESTLFDEKTVLPDAKPIQDENGNHLKLKVDFANTIYDKYWTPETDMRRYTDSEHADFWQPHYLNPEYMGLKPRWLREQAED